MGVSADLELTLDQALASVDELEARLTEVTTGVTLDVDASALEADVSSAIEDASTVITPELDESSFAADLASLFDDVNEVLAVDADTDPALSELDALFAEFEGTTIDVPVEVEGVEEATAEVSELGSTSTEAASGLSDLADGSDLAAGGLAGLGGLAGAASGDLSGLGGSLSALGGDFAVVGGATAAVAVPFQGFINQGLEATSTAQRFGTVTGDLADSVRSVDVGGLAGDFGDLTLQLGSSDEAALNVAASFFEMGTNSGVAGNEVADTTNQIEALALRARARNPALEVDQAFQGLSRGLARGGRFLGQYGIALTSAEIKARALADTGKTATTDLTQYDLAAAGAALSTERLGDSIGSDFQAGLSNSAIQVAAIKERFAEFQEGLGQDVLPKFIETLDEIEPAAEDAASGLATLGSSGLDQLADAVTVVTALGDALDAIPGGAAAAGIALQSSQLINPLTQISGIIEGLGGGGGLEEILPDKFFAGAEESATGFGTALDSVADSEQRTADGAKSLTDAVDAFLASQFDVPAAERELRSSFDKLFATLAGDHSVDDVNAGLEDIVSSATKAAEAVARQGGTQEEVNGVLDITRQRLLNARDAGLITTAQFRTYSGVLDGVTPIVQTTVKTPGLPTAISGAHNFRAELDRIPRDINVHIRVAADVAGAAQALHDIRTAADIANNESAAVPLLGSAPTSTTGVGGRSEAAVFAPGAIVVSVTGDADPGTVAAAVHVGVSAAVERRQLRASLRASGRRR